MFARPRFKRATRLRAYLVSSYLNHELERPHHEQTMHDNHVRGITFFDQSHRILRVDLQKEKKKRKKEVA